MSLLGNVNVADNPVQEKDSLGGASLLESGLADFTINMAYSKVANSGALGIVLHLTPDEGRELRETLWIASGNAKGNKTYYEREGVQHNLPGFDMFRAITLMTAGVEPDKVTTEEKIIKLWSSETSKEEPTTVPVLTQLLGQKIIGGVLKIVENKQVKGNNGYVNDPTGATRERNELDKVFHAGTRRTLPEAIAGETEATFIDKWAAKNTGVTVDKVQPVTPASGVPSIGAPSAPAPGAPAAPAPTQAPTASIFGA